MRDRRRPVHVLAVLGLFALAAMRFAADGQAPTPNPGAAASPEPPSDEEVLKTMGVAVTGGAAPGYVNDDLCASCHGAIADSYREVGMARAFYRPRPDRDVEDFERPAFFHERSQQRLELRRRADQLVFRRWQDGPDGKPINEFEQQVDWILGSGNHARTYLYRTPGDELYQLPLAWYGQTRTWGMAPGYDRKDHDGVTRRVRRECMFCHNAYPDVPGGSDLRDAPHTFPQELPEGLGCQRCHGPAARHVRAALGGERDAERLRATIVNPARLPPQLRDDVCFGCHMQPAVALSGIRRFGRGDYSFRPGQPLPEYLVQMDVSEEGRARSERFEINHHPYRLRQSRCWTPGAGKLSCLTCHDPHRKLPAEKRAAHYRAACQTCHAPDACSRTGHGQAPGADPGDCVACHMPQRRTQDVVRVTMTDHLIRRHPGGPELLAALEESEPILTDAEALEPQRLPSTDLAQMCRTLAVLRAVPTEAAVAHLEKLLAAQPLLAPEPWLDLAAAQLKRRRHQAARKTLAALLEREPGLPAGRALDALALARTGQVDQAIVQLRGLSGDERLDRPEADYNLGVLLLSRRLAAEAALALRRALDARPTMAPAWFQLGKAQAAAERPEDAARSYRRALEIDPTHGAAYLGLGRTLLDLGRRDEALRYWRHGARAAAQPAPIAEALAREERAAAKPPLAAR